jgi:dipeptidyl aminopeptidase/acylaminoacyl peptidase
MKRLICLTGLLMIGYTLRSQEKLDYQMPPKAIADLVNADPTPSVAIDADGKWMIYLDRPNLPAISELAQDELRLAGLRINPDNSGPSRGGYMTQIRFAEIATHQAEDAGTTITGLPENPRIGGVSWGPSGRRIAFYLSFDYHIELWIADIASGAAEKISRKPVNNTMPGLPYTWTPDGNAIFYRAVPERGPKPQAQKVPTGPNIQENIGRQAPSRTYQDLLTNPHEEALFEWYCRAEIRRIDLKTGTDESWLPPAIYGNVSPSPDGKYVLVETIEKPFSYLVPWSRFPSKVQVLDANAILVKHITDIPLADNIPIAFGSVMTGPRGHGWRNDEPATLYWVTALDGGDAKQDAKFRDQLWMWKAPFKGAPVPSLKTKLRYAGITWHSQKQAVIYEYWWNTRRRTTGLFDPSAKKPEVRMLFDRSTEDRYNDPGNFLSQKNVLGEYVLLTDAKGSTAYLTGMGASPEGNIPFVDKIDLKTLEKERIWQSQAPQYQMLTRMLNPETGEMIIRSESADSPPNYSLINLSSGESKALSAFKHPYPALQKVTKQEVPYTRSDGIALSGNLYLPDGYDAERDGPLPVLMWAYPNEYKSKDAASQKKGSPYEFLRLFYGSPIYWITQGYAVFDNISMPIVATEEGGQPNDTFITQLVDNARAAIDKLAEIGVGDPNRVAIGGHSYGAFMTANLLAHSDLFAAGIARSGAYNRTLTPFGFQSEDRTLWDAPELYLQMSPYMFAHKIKAPLLFIHGEADNNPGTFPMQSERMYNAVKGHGGTTRLVMLPHESHGYSSHESINHMLWETHEWLERWVKNKKTEE